MHKPSTKQTVLIYALLAVVLIVFLTPIYLIAASSVKPSTIMFQKPPAFLFAPTWEHYHVLFTERPFLKFIGNSLIVALGSTAVSLFFGSLAAYAISRIKHRRMNDVAFWILSLRMFPPITVVVPYYIIFKTAGLLDTPLALIIVYSTANIPLVVWLMKDRGVAMVFQNYALYPHMSVRQNMEFSLRPLKLAATEVDRRVRETAAILGLERLLDRRPAELSGGQRQRVAMARAMVRTPEVFLFDEPLSNLDAKLRTQVRWEIGKLHKRLGTTVLYVTHDQVEAMTLADKIVIMRDGHVEQVGSPEEVYARPRNTFVATFIGSPAMNLVNARVMGGRLQAEAFALPIPERFSGRLEEGQAVLIGIRPSDVSLSPDGLPATVEVTEFLGDDALLNLRLGPHELIAQVPANQRPTADEAVRILFALEQLHLFDAASGQSLLS